MKSKVQITITKWLLICTLDFIEFPDLCFGFEEMQGIDH